MGAPPSKASLWSELRSAIRGTDADYTTIPLRKAVFLLAVPMVLELVLESTFAVVDIWFVARLGSSAVATVGLTESYLFLLYAIAMGLAMAVTAVVARRVGEHKAEEASVSAVQAIWIAVLASVPFAIAGIFWARDLLRWMGADPWTLVGLWAGLGVISISGAAGVSSSAAVMSSANRASAPCRVGR